MLRHIVRAAVLVLVAVAVAAAATQKAQQTKKSPGPARLEQALAGELRKVDQVGKTIVVKTATGTEEVLRFTEQTTVRGLKEGAKVSELAGKEGTHLVVHYSEEGAEKVARVINHVGKEALEVTEGTIVRFDRAGRTLVVKTAGGVEETFRLTDRVTIESGKRIVRFADASFREGERVTVHYTEEAGHKIAHLLKHTRRETTD
jgi:Cu/Ag efflux protein CusF